MGWSTLISPTSARKPLATILTKMRNTFTLIFLIPIFGLGQQTDTVITRGHFNLKNVEFTFQKIEHGFYYNDKGLIDSSQKESQFVVLKNNKIVFTNTLRLWDGDCNSITLELGDFAVTDSSIIFYSYYAWMGGCCGLPYGARLQTYKLDDQGNLFLDNSNIYLERYKEKLSTMDKERRKKWVLETESSYNARFVFGATANKLMDSVKSRLAKQISKETEDWPKSPLGIKYGYKR